MKQIIHPVTHFSGFVAAPPSKSHAQRVLACALLSLERTLIHGLGQSEDEKAALSILERSVFKPSFRNNTIEVPAGNKLQFESSFLSFGESGLATRMFTPILANSSQELHLQGHGTLIARSMHLFDQVFPTLGADFTSKGGNLPFRIRGPIVPKNFDIDGSISSQFITGFLYSFAGNNLTRTEKINIFKPSSIPYIELSLNVLREFGVHISFNGHEIQFDGPYHFEESEITIEGDWSSAAFLLVSAALFGSIAIGGLKEKSNQADMRIVEVLGDYGAQISWKDGILSVSRNEFRSFNFDATHCPDLFPPLAVLASYGTSVSRISGLHRLFGKESNRVKTIVKELSKLGAKIEISGDTMVIYPRANPISFDVSSHHDHRIAMACAIFALGLTSAVTISHAEAINKSFPDFYKYLENLTV